MAGCTGDNEVNEVNHVFVCIFGRLSGYPYLELCPGEWRSFVFGGAFGAFPLFSLFVQCTVCFPRKYSARCCGEGARLTKDHQPFREVGQVALCGRVLRAPLGSSGQPAFCRTIFFCGACLLCCSVPSRRIGCYLLAAAQDGR